MNSPFPTPHSSLLLLLLLLLSSCSTTRLIPEGEQLFTGLAPITYTDADRSPHAVATREEMEAALATAPNGALLGSSYHRSPLQVGLWVWNAFSGSKNIVARWLTRAFGSRPKLLGDVNPALRASVAESQLRKEGYFRGRVTWADVAESHPKKAKIAYTVTFGPLSTIDTLTYRGYGPAADSLIQSSRSQALVRGGQPFTLSALEGERQRVATLLRDHGYFHYQSTHASYIADTLRHPGRVSLTLAVSDSLQPATSRQYTMGKTTISLRRQYGDTLTRQRGRRNIIMRYNGRKPPVRMGLLRRSLKMRQDSLYSATDQAETESALAATGLFSYTNITFSEDTTRDTPHSTPNTPHSSLLTPHSSLNTDISLLLDMPYDFYVEGGASGKTTGQMGPELAVGLTKRNAFRGGERLDINLHGSYEWQTSHPKEQSGSGLRSYNYGGDITLTLPRILSPLGWLQGKRGRRRRFNPALRPATTDIKASIDILERSGYFRRHVISGSLTYRWQSSERLTHTFSPLTLAYEYMGSQTEAFAEILERSPYLSVSMRDRFVPKMSYTLAYHTARLTWETTVSEAGNLISLGYMAAGRRWSEEGKRMFHNPFAQFVRVETDVVGRWQTSGKSALVAHLGAGIIGSYGNARVAPYYEQYYVGGANSVRAFNVRSIGPGCYQPADRKHSYVEQTGDFKLLANVEYRPHLMGSLYGALFLDAGNVWSLRDDDREGGRLRLGQMLRQMAVGTGVGLRYDAGIFVIRVDWGVGLHVPYDTQRSGFYNVPSFRDAQSLHLAIGYPF